jgi:hypothetical protein
VQNTAYHIGGLTSIIQLRRWAAPL